MHNWIFVVVILSALSAFLCSCESPKPVLEEKTEELHRVLKVQAGMSLAVHNRNGDIRIDTWDKDSVDVFALKKTRVRRSELKKVSIDIEETGGLLIESKYSDTDVRVSVDYRIKVPAGFPVTEARTENGSIEIAGVKGDAYLTVANGKINITNVDGYVTAKTRNGSIISTGTTGIHEAATMNGNIRAEVRSLSESGADFSVNNGSIALHVLPTLDADLELGTSNGRIDIHDVEISRLESAPKRVKGRMGEGGGRVYARTTNGNIDLFRLQTGD